jgi:predicted nucleotidyltransferase/DNA-binding XRE family transcriptional regulator
MLRHTYVTTMLDAGVDLRDVQIAARRADPRTTMRYDRARTNLDRHPNYILAPYWPPALDALPGTGSCAAPLKIVTIRYGGLVDGATVLRAARLRAHLTQGELAAQAGITQSVVSAYESGRRQPSVPTLAALVAATGFELELRLRATPQRLDPLVGPIGRRVRRQRRRLLDTARAHGISKVLVFGSVARGEDRPDSDLDLLVDLPASMGLVGLGRVRDELESVLGCRVDLVPATDLKAGVREHVEAEMIAL